MIELKNVSFTYARGDGENGLQGINLKVERGEVVLLCGTSGCGKTTLTRLINGLIPHYYEGMLEGEVTINGQAVSQLPLYELAKMVGSVFQNPRSQFFNVDTTSELAFGCENQGLPREVIEARLHTTVSDFKLHSLMNRSLFHLSGGEKQKIACASVTACHPEKFVLDEPSSNLDTAAIEDLRRFMEQWKALGKTIIIAEHRLAFLRNLVDRAVYLKNGSIVREFTARQFRALSADELETMGMRPLCLKELKAAQPAGADQRLTEAQESTPLAEENHHLCLSRFEFAYHSSEPVLRMENLTIPKTGVTAIIGDNGAGKSTFARCLCGLEKRCSGLVTMGGIHWGGRERLKRCYMVMQDVNHQLFAESVMEEVLLSMQRQKTKEATKITKATETPEAKAEIILKSLNLLHLKERHPMSLSGGQKQRVAIAGAVASHKDILIFDEPTSGLDLVHMKEVAAVLAQLRRMGKTILIISHDLELILKSCTHVVCLEKGRVTDSYPLNGVGVNKLKAFFGSGTVSSEPVEIEAVVARAVGH
ncbi:ABC transporter ATP-binding protein [Anoxynatronum buryatiense]|uniref:Energy-coupling factor transport system ATP-binding protein n=1 Tax=Anoxynatronum buryatiense TaxID=489973 RepID=A0AA45WYL5_9CLOT|nr:ABC transporter ATP-binding protein [Anoxynatronum buryatiense]SMP68736.1 energy-coupling factor transport system ATP-binding protein [Anoxynatronum buryatiense]